MQPRQISCKCIWKIAKNYPFQTLQSDSQDLLSHTDFSDHFEFYDMGRNHEIGKEYPSNSLARVFESKRDLVYQG